MNNEEEYKNNNDIEADDEKFKFIKSNNLDINEKTEKTGQIQTELKTIDDQNYSDLKQNEDEEFSDNNMVQNNNGGVISIKKAEFSKPLLNQNMKYKENRYILFLIIVFILSIVIYFMLLKNSKKYKMDIIKNDLKTLVKQYEYLLDKSETIPEDSPIWIMWYQGIKEAPLHIKSCIQSVLINKAKHPVYLVDKENLNKYIDLPDYILTKFNEGKFSITHFSDIVGMALLSKYGGYWISSTYFVQTPLVYNNYSLFTLKLSQCNPDILTKCRWAGNFLAMPKNSFLSVFSYNAFLLYWRYYDELIDYFLIDEIIAVAFDNVPKLRTLIDKLPYIECDIFSLYDLIDKELNISNFQCLFNKLNRQIKNQTTINKKKTNYGYLIDEYKLDLNKIDNLNDCLK